MRHSAVSIAILLVCAGYWICVWCHLAVRLLENNLLSASIWSLPGINLFVSLGNLFVAATWRSAFGHLVSSLDGPVILSSFC